jgi:hypothetical protein
VWTAYIFIGSCLKDQRMTFYLGDRYREYASRVPGYPAVFFGPLAKWQRADDAQAVRTAIAALEQTRAA